LSSTAVDAAWYAGRRPRAQELLVRARPLSSEPAERAEIDRWRGLIEWSIGVPGTAMGLLADAAADLPDDDPARALHLVGLACIAAAYGGNEDKVPSVAGLASAPDAGGSAVVDFLRAFVAGTQSYFAGGYEAAAESFRESLALADIADTAGSELFFSIPLFVGAAGLFLGDDDAAEQWNHRLATRAREAGAVPVVNDVAPRLAMNWIALGRWSSAAAELTEGIRLAEEVGQHQVLAHMLSVQALLAGLLGEADSCRRGAEHARDLATARQLVHVEHTARWAMLVLELADGRHDEAYLHAVQMPHLPIGHWAGPERIEAAARAGHHDEATTWLADFAAWADSSDTRWARSGALRCRALLTDDPEEQLSLLADALALAAGSRPFEEARTRLAYGEALRRNGQRVESRTHLRAALDRFDGLGAAVWAERAREQLRASGQTARRRTSDDQGSQLTQQELQIARFVAQGRSNRDVAAQLFLSPRTIEFHLRKVFAKLGIASRTQLAHIDLDGHRLEQPTGTQH
jgi:ATP/maltotriose-dependent transcriptional regulator MalT